MGTINTARAYRIDHRVGSHSSRIRSGHGACGRPQGFQDKQSMAQRKRDKKTVQASSIRLSGKALNSVKLEQLRPEDIALECGGKEAKVRVLTAEDLSLATTIDIMDAKVEDGRVIPDVTRDILKGVVLERFGRGKGHNTGAHKRLRAAGGRHSRFHRTG